MTTKHTAGPWVMDADGDVCTDDLEQLVAAVDWRHVSLRDGEAAANARVIAAAPDLLAACEVLLDAVARGDHKDKALRTARAAIAKAKGEP